MGPSLSKVNVLKLLLMALDAAGSRDLAHWTDREWEKCLL